jgi:hypothetical protein
MPSDSEHPDSERAAVAGAAAGTQYTERRANRRYDLSVEFDLFHLWGVNHLIWAGAGKTRNWSRNSILFDWDKPLAAGSSVELVVRWSQNVQLVVVGRVLNSAARGTVVRILRRRFRGKADLVEVTREAPPASRTSGERAS